MSARDTIVRSRILALAAGGAASFGVLVVAGSAPAEAAACSSPYVKGDVFASVGSGTVDVFNPTGGLACTLNDGTGATFTTGSGFDTAGNFYVTNFGPAGVSEFDNSGGLVAGTFMSPSSVTTPEIDQHREHRDLCRQLFCWRTRHAGDRSVQHQHGGADKVLVRRRRQPHQWDRLDGHGAGRTHDPL